MLSNLLGGANAASVGVSPCEDPEIPDALSLVFGSPPPRPMPIRSPDFSRFAGERGIDLAELWVAGADNRLCWAVLPIYSPGRTMLLLTPGELPVAATWRR